ncbi:hypothetical protein [Nocardioides stalactiti]|uniref:hypothetical protein n=1 Tax=Nocardioides stalactiti TaxID=2755356 RepID=UPI001600FDE0|nr:hypothetical protein [Nocardioides stalactiti]
MSNRRRLDADPIPGGCEDCHAEQVLHEEAPGVLVLTVMHDPTCPYLAKRSTS